jgi:hypothetical protein
VNRLTGVLSLGAGVQSTALSLMAARGELGPMPPLAVFADTGWEPAHVYRHLDWLDAELGQAGMRVIRAHAGSLRVDLVEFAEGRGKGYASPPLYLRGDVSDQGMLRRQCTREYKVDVIARALRAEGYGPTSPVEQWLGISLDEAVQRMRPSRISWIRSRWPLVEKQVTRQGCIRWLEQAGYPVPGKSACIGCPYHSDAVWRDLRDNRPDEWTDAVEVDRAIRRLPNVEGEAFLHRQRVPLDEVDLSVPEDHGQLAFADECEGMCGV